MLSETRVGGVEEETTQKMWCGCFRKEALPGKHLAALWLQVPEHPSADSQFGFTPDISCFLGPLSPLLSSLLPSAAHLVILASLLQRVLRKLLVIWHHKAAMMSLLLTVCSLVERWLP